jgi:DNA-binding IclR family transcriptional regulator
MQESDHWLTMNIRVGSRLPLLTTAIGRIFLAHLPETDVASLVAAERKVAHARGTILPPPEAIESVIDEVRRRRLARVPSAIIPGIDAVAAPVFDFADNLVAVICVVARSEAKITGWSGTAVRALSETAVELSARLGHAADRLPAKERGRERDRIATSAKPRALRRTV